MVKFFRVINGILEPNEEYSKNEELINFIKNINENIIAVIIIDILEFSDLSDYENRYISSFNILKRSDCNPNTCAIVIENIFNNDLKNKNVNIKTNNFYSGENHLNIIFYNIENKFKININSNRQIINLGCLNTRNIDCLSINDSNIRITSIINNSKISKISISDCSKIPDLEILNDSKVEEIEVKNVSDFASFNIIKSEVTKIFISDCPKISGLRILNDSKVEEVEVKNITNFVSFDIIGSKIHNFVNIFSSKITNFTIKETSDVYKIDILDNSMLTAFNILDSDINKINIDSDSSEITFKNFKVFNSKIKDCVNINNSETGNIYVQKTSIINKIKINNSSKVENILISQDSKIKNFELMNSSIINNILSEINNIDEYKNDQDIKIPTYIKVDKINNIKISNCHFNELTIRADGNKDNLQILELNKVHVEKKLYFYKLGNKNSIEKNNTKIKIEDCRFNEVEVLWCKINTFTTYHTTINEMVINNINVIKFMILDSLIKDTIISNLTLLNNVDKYAYIYFQDTIFNKYNMQHIKWYEAKETKDYENIIYNVVDYSQYVLDSVKIIQEDIKQSKIEALSNLKNTYNLIKTSYNQDNNYVASDKIATLEKYIYEEELKNNKKEPLLDKVLFWLNGVVSDHHHNLLKVIGWYFVCSMFWFLVSIIFNHKILIINVACIVILFSIKVIVSEKDIKKQIQLLGKPSTFKVLLSLFLVISFIIFIILILSASNIYQNKFLILIVSEWLYPVRFNSCYEDLYFMPIFHINTIFHTYFIYQIIRITHKLFKY